MKRFITYLLYGLGLLLLIYFGVKYQGELRMAAGRNFDPLPPVLFTAVYSILFGACLDLPGLVTRLRGPGKVRFDWLKFLIIGVPALVVSFSSVLPFYLEGLAMTVQWIYLKFGLLGTAFAGAACGYTLLSSISKEEAAEILPVRKYPPAKIITLFLTAAVILYIPLNGVIHPIKLVSVRTDVSDDQNNALAAEGGTIPKQINYVFTFENMPYGTLRGAIDGDKIRVEPKEKLQGLIQSQAFKEKAGGGYSQSGSTAELTISYSIEPQYSEDAILSQIKNSLLDADLVLEMNNKTIRYDLLDYQAN